MAKRYFKKSNPDVPIYGANGGRIQFEKVSPTEGIIGLNNPAGQQELINCINQQRGGVTEITEAEFEELKKNSNPGSLRPWREEISNMDLQRVKPIIKAPSLSVAVAEAEDRTEIPTRTGSVQGPRASRKA